MADETINSNVHPPAADSEQSGRRPVSEAQMNANKANAQFSTGATTRAGHEASSMNALKHGMCSMKVVLPGDSATAYEQLIASHFNRNSPQTDQERELVQMIADNTWRLLKVPFEEQLIQTTMLHEGAMSFPQVEEPALLAALKTGRALSFSDKPLRNLRLHERRIRKQIADDTAKLEEIQKERMNRPARQAKEAEEENFRQVSRILGIAKEAATYKIPFDPIEFGFDLSVSEFKQFKNLQENRYFLCKEYLDIKTLIARVKSTPPVDKVA